MPIEHEPGAIATFRNVPQTTRDAIGSLAMLLKLPAGQVIADAIASHVEKLIREERLPAKLDRLIERQAQAGAEERTAVRSVRQTVRSWDRKSSCRGLGNVNTAASYASEASRCITPDVRAAGTEGVLHLTATTASGVASSAGVADDEPETVTSLH